MKSVYVSIIDFDGKDTTIECLKSINLNPKDNFELTVLVINNYSKKLTLPSFSKFNLKVIENGKNLGFSGGHNKGIKYALKNGADYVLILNNDVVIDPSLISELIKVLEKNSTYGVASPKIYFAPGFEFYKDKYKEKDKGRVLWYAGGIMDFRNVTAKHRGVDEVDRGQYQKTEETDFSTGACLLVKKEVLERVGFFDDKYFLYYEDSDLSQRVKNAGYKIIYAPDAVAWHRNAASVGGSGSSLQDYYISRNRLLFGLKYAPLRSKIALIRESIRLLTIGREWQKKGVRDFYLRRLGKGRYPI